MSDPILTLIAAIERLGADKMPHSPGLRQAWPGIGREWIVPWVVELGRDLGLAGESLTAAAAAGPDPDGVAHVEVALWRMSAAREKFHAVVALTFGVPALRLMKKGIRRFEPDPRANRARLRELATEHLAAAELADIDHALSRHRFLRLRHQLTHSLAPILEWRSLVWFEISEVERGSVMRYEGRSLEPARELQGAIPRDELFERTVADGREAVEMLSGAVRKLAELVASVGVLAPPPVVWRVVETGEVFLDRSNANAASLSASGTDG